MSMSFFAFSKKPKDFFSPANPLPEPIRKKNSNESLKKREGEQCVNNVSEIGGYLRGSLGRCVNSFLKLSL